MDYNEQLRRMNRAAQTKSTTMNLSMYDTYAAAALQALIAKLPFVDRDGEFSEPHSQGDVDKLKEEIARSAHSYAWFMVKNRQEFIDSLKAADVSPQP
jgi:hypothetical protein